MTEFTPVSAFIGGSLIGLSAVLLMALNGRIAGVTGILLGLLPSAPARDWPWRLAFILAAIATPAAYWIVTNSEPPFDVPVGGSALVIGGLIVGAGVTLGSGCTSGHGICGLARFSMRSAVAVLVFMATTAVTVFIVRHVLGG